MVKSMFQSGQNMSGVFRKRIKMVGDTSGVPNGLQNLCKPLHPKLIIGYKKHSSAIPNLDPAPNYCENLDECLGFVANENTGECYVRTECKNATTTDARTLHRP